VQIMNNVPRGTQNSRLGKLVSAMVKLAHPALSGLRSGRQDRASCQRKHSCQSFYDFAIISSQRIQ